MPRSRIWRISVHQVGRLARVHPGGRLVEQQELRVGGQRAGDLEPALVAVGEVLGQFVVLAGEPDEREQLAAFAASRSSRGAPSRARERVPPCRVMPTRTFSSTVMAWNRRMFWNVRAMPTGAMTSGVRRARRHDDERPGGADDEPRREGRGGRRGPRAAT